MPNCCACNGGNCTHYGVPHAYCSGHDPADWYGTAIPIAPPCPQCARFREKIAGLEHFIRKEGLYDHPGDAGTVTTKLIAYLTE